MLYVPWSNAYTQNLMKIHEFILELHPDLRIGAVSGEESYKDTQEKT